MARLISSKDLLAEAGYKPSSPTVSFDEFEVPKNKKPSIDLGNLDPDLQGRIAKMQEDWKNNKELNPQGLDLPITSGARTSQQQEDLKKRAAAGEKGIFTPADVPKGASMVHMNAIDLPTSVPDSFLAQYGLFRPLVKKGDPVHVQIDPNSSYAAPSFQGISSADLLKQAESLTPESKAQEYNPTEPYKPGFYNPNLVAQGKTAREAGGGNLQPVVEGITNALKSMSIEDWKKESTLANMLKYGVGSMPIVGDQGFYQEGKNKLIESGKSGIQALMNPSETIQAISQAQPGDLLGQLIKGGLYDVPLGPSSKPILNVAKTVAQPVITAGKQAMPAIMQGMENVQGGLNAYKNTINPQKPIINKSTEPLPANVTPISTLSGVGAAVVENNPFSGKLSGESYGRGEIFPQIKLAKIAGDVSPEEQVIRAQILKPILKDSEQIRPGVLSGNEQTLRAEHNAASRPERTPGGEMFKRQIVNEQNALTNYAKERIEKTGASNLLVDDAERGEALNNAFIGHYDPKTKEFEGFTGFVNKLKSEVYDQAKKAVGENPIKSTHIDSLLNDEQFKAGLGLKEGNESVARSAEKLINLAKTVGFKDPITGQKYKPNSINGFIAVKKALNEKWDHNNKNIIGQVNRAIDQDIFAAGGEDLFKKGDALHQAEKIIFESKGMDTIFGEFDPNGIKKGVDQDKIMKKLNGLDTAQWKHIYNTADDISKGTIRVKGYEFKIPESVIEQANMIKSEMKGSIAREIFAAGEDKAGVWNQNSANKIMNSRQGKIRYAFDPEEQQAFYRLNLAGQIMPGVHSYEGGAMQAERMGWGQRVAEKIPFLAGSIASAGSHGTGTGVGIAVGEAGKNLLLRNLSKKDAAKMQETMKSNYNLGNLMELKKGNEQ